MKSIKGSDKVVDPIKLATMMWPNVNFYREQRDIIYSVVENRETLVRAGNMLGKDFVAAFIVLWFFLTRHPCRVVTTSADHSQLESVLWGEIRRFIQTAKYPLLHTKGGPLVVNHLHIRKMVNKEICGVSYIRGRVAAKGEGMLGHHVTPESGFYEEDGIPRTLFVADEASGVDDVSKERADTWANRELMIGNPYPCDNFFYKLSKEGDKWDEEGQCYRRKTFCIKAQDSPNVRYAQAMIKAGKNPGYRSLVPGVIGHREYMARREDWDDIRKCIGLDGEFYEGAEVLLYPPMWLDKAHRVSNDLRGAFRRARAIGIDTAEGGDKTAFAAVDEYGIIEVVSLKTPNTAKVPGMIRAFMHKHKVGPDMTVMDQGGGGKGHWDRLRENEEDPITIRMVAFGSPVSPDEHYGYKTSERKQDESGERYRYKNRRAQMFGALRELLDPSREQGWGIPAGYMNLRKELAPIPLLWDEEGRMFLPPKRRRSGDDPVKKGGKKMKSLEELIGHSPDEADAVVLAIFGMQHPVDAPVAGTAW